jgi:hypothetical protein
MANKKVLGALGMALVFGAFLAGCSTPAPIRPALSQTVINVRRSSTSLDSGDLYIRG